jgi:methionyl-tRNA formyltransferase
MRLIMLGTGPFAVPTLRALAATPHEIALVISRPPTGRNREASPMQQAGESLGIPVWTPETVNAPEAQARLTSLAPDLLVVCDYGEILKPETLSVARLGGINLHGSLLPKYRGAAPVQWAILNGDAETGNSVIQMTPGLDAGPCLAQQRTPIDADEDAGQLEARLAAMGADAVLRVLEELERGTSQPVAQDKTLASKAPRLTKEQGAIDWSQPAQAIKNQVRGLRPWPRAYTFWHHGSNPPIRLNIDCVGPIITGDQYAMSYSPGSIIKAGDQLIVATCSGPLEVLVLQPAGKRSMKAEVFLRGYRMHPDDWLGPA